MSVTSKNSKISPESGKKHGKQKSKEICEKVEILKHSNEIWIERKQASKMKQGKERSETVSVWLLNTSIWKVKVSLYVNQEKKERFICFFLLRKRIHFELNGYIQSQCQMCTFQPSSSQLVYILSRFVSVVSVVSFSLSLLYLFVLYFHFSIPFTYALHSGYSVVFGVCCCCHHRFYYYCCYCAGAAADIVVIGVVARAAAVHNVWMRICFGTLDRSIAS